MCNTLAVDVEVVVDVSLNACAVCALVGVEEYHFLEFACVAVTAYSSPISSKVKTIPIYCLRVFMANQFISDCRRVIFVSCGSSKQRVVSICVDRSIVRATDITKNSTVISNKTMITSACCSCG